MTPGCNVYVDLFVAIFVGIPSHERQPLLLHLRPEHRPVGEEV
jgi:hypothetical protein